VHPVGSYCAEVSCSLQNIQSGSGAPTTSVQGAPKTFLPRA